MQALDPEKYLLQVITRKLSEKKVPVLQIASVHEQFVLAFKASSEELEKFFQFVSTEYGTDFSEVKDYLIGSSAKEMHSSNAQQEEASNSLADAIFYRMKENNLKSGVFVVDKKITYSRIRGILFNIMRRYFKESGSEKNLRSRVVFPFIISNNFQGEGIVAAQMKGGKVEVILGSASFYREASEELEEFTNVYFFGDKKIASASHHFSAPYYVYKWHCNEKDYIVFSNDPVDPGTVCTVNGMIVDTRDESKLGEKFSLPIDFRIIFATSIKPQITEIDQEECKKRVYGWGHEQFAEKLFGLYRQPQWFEKMVMAMVISGKFEGYPLHLGVFGPTGSGKTRAMLNPLRSAFQEEMVYEGTFGTIKGLIPNFGKGSMDPGYFVRCKRFCLIDEFFQLFKSSSGGKEGIEVSSGYLTSLLEHQLDHGGSSGKTESFKVKARARAFAVTNPYYKSGSLVEAAQVLNNPMLSRFFWYVQIEPHIEFNRNRKGLIRNVPEDKRLPAADPRFLEIVDFLQSFQVEVPNDQVDSVIKKAFELVPIELENIYKGRYDHHFSCLLDGITKLNAIFEKRESFDVTQTDIDEAEVIFSIVVGSWSQTKALDARPIYSRSEFLPLKARQVFDVIEKNPGCSVYEADKLSGVSAVAQIERLLESKLISRRKIQNGSDYSWALYPYWYEEEQVDNAKEVNANELQ